MNARNQDLFNEYLVSFQEDIKKIVGKFKKKYHSLSDDEIYSECNIHLLKNRDKIIESFGDTEMPESEFKKIAYHYCKNETSWSHYNFNSRAYNRRKLDSFQDTEDGLKTTFESVIDTQGEEDADLDNDYDFFQKISQRFFHILLEYSYVLTETECKVLSYIQKGWSQERIGERLNVTHQAISACFVSIQEKLNCYFDFNEIMESDSGDCILQGKSELDNFFVKNVKPKISSNDRKKIKNFLIKNPCNYKAQDVNRILFKNKFSNRQVACSITKSKLNYLLKKRFKFNQNQKSKALEYFTEGKTPSEVSALINCPLTQVRCLRGLFVKDGLLHPSSKS